MKKKTDTSPKKQMSEGKAIVLSVLLFGAGLSIFIYVLQLFFNFIFPNF